jgi:hypothetical protein
MAYWAVVLSSERHDAQRLFHHDTVELTWSAPQPGDEVVLVADGLVFGLGQVCEGASEVAYTRRLLDAPIRADGLAPGEPGAYPLSDSAYAGVVAGVGGEPADETRRGWLVSLDLPIEASSPAEAVRLFWTYVTQLGPTELPAFVSPSGDELAMQAFVLGTETNLDPEEED